MSLSKRGGKDYHSNNIRNKNIRGGGTKQASVERSIRPRHKHKKQYESQEDDDDEVEDDEE